MSKLHLYNTKLTWKCSGLVVIMPTTRLKDPGLEHWVMSLNKTHPPIPIGLVNVQEGIALPDMTE